MDIHLSKVNNTEKLHNVFREIFGVKKVSDKTTRKDIPEWNSMQTINLVLAIEEEFSVTLTPEEAAEMLSVDIVKDILLEKGITF